MKKIIISIVLLFGVFLITGCQKEVINQKAIDFKNEYEALNGKTNDKGKDYRVLSISEDNPFEKVEASNIVEMYNDGETFYVYFGDPLCPWCRSVLEKAIEVAKENGIDKIYYVRIWDKDKNEILRSKYELNDEGQLEKTSEGTEDYYALLKYFGELLDDYTITNEDGKKIETGEKRIYAPTFVYVKNGIAEKLTEGISESQEDPYGKLTEEMLDDEEQQFNDFFAE